MSVENPTIEDKKAKDKIIKAEKKKLKTLLADIEPNRLKAAEGIIEECAFMCATLKQYRDYINTEGLIDVMEQGNYKIKREHPAVRSYTTLVQKYTSTCKQLFDLLPAKAIENEEYNFDEFRNIKQSI